MCKFYKECLESVKNTPFYTKVKDSLDTVKDDNKKSYLAYLYMTMPYSDLADIKEDILLDYVEQADFLRKNRAKNIEEDIFLKYILYHRVNNEKIVKNRTYFYSLLKNNLIEDDFINIINTNYFCATHVKYTSTDERTLDPITIFNSGFGRCGEESTFVVSVFRSLGIPARQVYVPFWAHTDDNHAWVEVYYKGKWHYLGACEPEEILDKGWFDAASARAIYIRNRIFNRYILEENQIKRYANTKNIKFIFTKGKEKLVDLKVNIYLINYASFYKLTNFVTDSKGEKSLDLGIGTIFISFYFDKLYLLPINLEDIKEDVSTYEIDILDDRLEYKNFEYIDGLVIAPRADSRNLKEAKLKRDYKYIEKEKLNSEVEENIISSNNEYKILLWNNLVEKDKRDITLDIIEDAIRIPNKYNINKNIYIDYILNPRIKFENLEVNRVFLSEKFSSITDILDFVKSISIVEDEFISSAKNIYKYRICSKLALKIFIINALRSLSIAAKLVDENIYLYNTDTSKFELSKEFYELIENKKLEISVLNFNFDKDVYNEDFSILKYDESINDFVVLEKDSISKNMQLVSGKYLLLTAVRLPNGNIAYKYMNMNLEQNKIYEVELSYKEVDFKEYISSYILQDSILNSLGLNESKSNYKLVLYLEENAEPSKHIINELLDKKQYKYNFIFAFINTYEAKDIEIEKLKSELDSYMLYDNLGSELQEKFGRNLFVNHETLPIIALFDKNNTCIYAFSGYSVGSIDLIDKIMEIKNDE